MTSITKNTAARAVDTKGKDCTAQSVKTQEKNVIKSAASSPALVVNKPRQIYSRNNFQIRRIRELHQQEERRKTSRFFVTGLRFLIQASQQHAKIETLVVAPKLLTSVPGQRLVRKLRQQGTTCLEVP